MIQKHKRLFVLLLHFYQRINANKIHFCCFVASVCNSHINVFRTQHAEQHQITFCCFIFYGYLCIN